MLCSISNGDTVKVLLVKLNIGGVYDLNFKPLKPFDMLFTIDWEEKLEISRSTQLRQV